MRQAELQGCPPRARLLPHALERCLERAHRAPSWLEDVLQTGQFVHLRQLPYKTRRAVLVFDALLDQHIVVVLDRHTVKAITVITAEQYQSTYGPIPVVLFSLARQARQQALAPTEAPRPEARAYPLSVDQADRASRKRASRWQASWFCFIDLDIEQCERCSMRARLTPELKQRGLVEAHVARTDATVAEAVNAVAQAAFPVQACLLAASGSFLQWLAGFLESQGVDPAHLVCVRLGASCRQNAALDVTQSISQALSEPV